MNQLNFSHFSHSGKNYHRAILYNGIDFWVSYKCVNGQYAVRPMDDPEDIYMIDFSKMEVVEVKEKELVEN